MRSPLSTNSTSHRDAEGRNDSSSGNVRFRENDATSGTATTLQATGGGRNDSNDVQEGNIGNHGGIRDRGSSSSSSSSSSSQNQQHQQQMSESNAFQELLRHEILRQLDRAWLAQQRLAQLCTYLPSSSSSGGDGGNINEDHREVTREAEADRGGEETVVETASTTTVAAPGNQDDGDHPDGDHANSDHDKDIVTTQEKPAATAE